MRTRRPDAARCRAGCAALALVAGCLALPACDLARAGRQLPAEGERGSWRWRPVALELSALTTPIPASGGRGPAIDARFTFRDDGGDESKAVGVLRVWVRVGDTGLAQATVDLAATDAHARAWDGVTETYSVRLDLPREPDPGTSVNVRAKFDGADGVSLDASGDVRWTGRPR